MFAVLVQDAATLYTLWPNGTCADLGLANEYNTTLLTMLEAMVNTSNPAGPAAMINAQLKQGLSGSGAGAGTGAAMEQVRAGTAVERLPTPSYGSCRHFCMSNL